MHRPPLALIAVALSLLAGAASSAAVATEESDAAVREVEEPGFHWTERRDYYDVRGATLAELRRELANSPLRNTDRTQATGLTAQGFSTRFVILPATEGCRLSDAQVELDVTIHLPRRASRTPLGRSAELAWEAMSAAMLRHEEGHRDNALRAGRDLRRRLEELPPMPCNRLRGAAQRVIDDVMLRLAIREEMYDRGTQHGVRQGVIL